MTRMKRRRRAQAKEVEISPLPETPFKTKLQIIGALGGIALLVFAVRDLRSVAMQKSAVEEQMQQWKSAYRLNDEQVARIRSIEIAFHGDGHILSKPAQTLQRRIQHHKDIAATMSAEEGVRFLQRFEPQLVASP